MMAVRRIHQMVEQLEETYPSERILVGGFSQGAALALGSVLQYPRKLAGAVLCSGWSVFRYNSFGAQVHEANRQTPVWIGHGVSDQMVLFSCALNLRDMLNDIGILPHFHEYVGMSHTSSEEEEADLVQFLHELFSSPSSISSIQQCTDP